MSANPHFNDSHQQLGTLCTALAIEISSKARRTAEQRSNLAARAADLLFEVGRRMTPEVYQPDRPERRVQKSGVEYFAEAFAGAAAVDERNARLRVLDFAAGLVMGDNARWWLNDGAALPGGGSPYLAAMDSPAGLMRGLQALQALAAERGVFAKRI